MDKKELLEQIQGMVRTGQVTREELLGAFDADLAQPLVQPTGAVTSPNEGLLNKLTKHVTIAEVMYYIGAGIVFIGICILVAQNWDFFNPFLRIFITLGSALAAYVIGFVFDRTERFDNVGVAFFLISALLLPLGLAVTLHEAGVDTYTNLAYIIISGICMTVFGLTYYAVRNNLFLFFTLVHGTWLFFALTGWISETSMTYYDFDFVMYRFLVVSVAYILLGYAFSTQPEREPLSGPLYLFGSLGLLSSTLALQGTFPNQNAFWELAYIGIVFGIILLSVYLKSKSFLTFGAIFLMVYILKITGEYFANSIGWPASLVVVGLLLIALGYYGLQFKRKYFSN